MRKAWTILIIVSLISLVMIPASVIPFVYANRTQIGFDFENLKNRIEDEEKSTFVLFFGTSACSYCRTLRKKFRDSESDIAKKIEEVEKKLDILNLIYWYYDYPDENYSENDFSPQKHTDKNNFWEKMNDYLTKKFASQTNGYETFFKTTNKSENESLETSTDVNGKASKNSTPTLLFFLKGKLIDVTQSDESKILIALEKLKK